MITPAMKQKPFLGQTWGADNGRFSSPHQYTDAKYIAWLRRMPVESCLFATAPDVVGDAKATMTLSMPMLWVIRELGYRAALVAQDGLENLTVPWDHFDVLFIGGSTEWKLGKACRLIAVEAKRRGKYLHMGRVNSYRRLQYAWSIGCDSVDGTFLKYGPRTNKPRLDAWFTKLEAQKTIWDL